VPQKNFDHAIADYTSAISLNPNYERAYNNRGTPYANNGNINEDLLDYYAVLKLSPQSAACTTDLELSVSNKFETLLNH